MTKKRNNFSIYSAHAHCPFIWQPKNRSTVKENRLFTPPICSDDYFVSSIVEVYHGRINEHARRAQNRIHLKIHSTNRNTHTTLRQLTIDLFDWINRLEIRSTSVLNAIIHTPYLIHWKLLSLLREKSFT